MHKVTKWFPDTCNCEIEVIWDDENTDIPLQHKIAKPCQRHTGLVGDNVLSENRKKNRNINKVRDLVPENMKQQVSFTVNEDGEIIIHSPVIVMVSLESGVKVNLIQ